MSSEITHSSALSDIGGGGSSGSRRFWALPASKLGRWAVGFGAFFFVFMAIFYALISAEVGFGEPFLNQWPLWGSILPAAACGFGAAGCGVLALVRKGERSILVFAVTLVGLFVVWFVSMELLFPH